MQRGKPISMKLMKNATHIHVQKQIHRYTGYESRIRYNCTVSSPAARHRLFLRLFIGKTPPYLPTHTHTHTDKSFSHLCPGGSPDPPTVVRAVILIFARHVQREKPMLSSYRCIPTMCIYLQLYLYLHLHLYLCIHV